MKVIVNFATLYQKTKMIRRHSQNLYPIKDSNPFAKVTVRGLKVPTEIRNPTFKKHQDCKVGLYLQDTSDTSVGADTVNYKSIVSLNVSVFAQSVARSETLTKA